LALAALVSSAGARAQAIDVKGTDGCVTEAGLRSAMQRYTARIELDPELRATVRSASQSLSFEVSRAGVVLAEREFESLPRRCAERVRAVAIAIALAFESAQARQSEAAAASEPARAGEPSSPSAEPAGTKAQKPGPSREAAPPTAQPASADESAEPVAEKGQEPPVADEEAVDAEQTAPLDAGNDRGGASVVLLAGGGVLLSVLPEPAAVLSLGAGFELGSLWQLEVAGIASPGVTTELADGLVDAQLYGGELKLCAGLPLGALRAAGCAGLAGGAVPARGRDFSVSGRSTLTGWTAALLAATLDMRVVGPLSLRIHAGLLGSFVRPTFEARVDGERRDATPFPIGGVLSAHVLWALP
jgi:hypothetical protein